MKDTQKNKAKFFSLYIRCAYVIYEEYYLSTRKNVEYREVLKGVISDSNGNNVITEMGDPDLEFCKLELPPLSEISKNHAKEIAEIINESVTNSETGEKVNYLVEEILKDPDVLGHATSHTADFCRYRGYAVDWNGISVEKQIEYGWVLLKNTERS